MKRKTSKPFNNKLSLCRYGGLNLVNQKNNYGRGTFHSAPERVGTYAFIFPYIELFLIGSTKNKEFNDGTYKKFHAIDGTIWTHLKVKDSSKVIDRSDEDDTWVKVNVSDMNAIIRQNYALETKHMIQMWHEWCPTPDKYAPASSGGCGNRDTRKQYKEQLRRNPWSWYSKDHLEVFITRDTKIQ